MTSSQSKYSKQVVEISEEDDIFEKGNPYRGLKGGQATDVES